MFASKTAFLVAIAASIIQTEAACTTGKTVHVIFARGTTEPQGTSLQQFIINDITKRLPGSDSESVVYPASFDLPGSVNQGIVAAMNQTTAYAQACPNSKIVLMGYSQGAQVIGDSISGGGTITPNGQATNPTPPLDSSVMSKVVGIVLFGDPNRIANQPYDYLTCTADATHPRTGAIAAKFNSYTNIIQDYCDAMDPVCCGTGMNILAHLGYFNDQNGTPIANKIATDIGA